MNLEKFSKICAMTEAREGIRAFLDKRPSKFNPE